MYRLNSCVWEITLACCFSCKYCGSKAGRARENELTTQECLSVARQLGELGCRRVSLIGGEVFMRSDWEQIVGELRRQNIVVNIITNGYALSEEEFARLAALDIESVSVSIDAPKEIHDKFRHAGSFDRAVETVRTLAAHGLHVSVISTLNGESVPRLNEFYETIRTLPIFAWQLQACSPMGNAVKSGMPYAFDMGEVIRFVTEHMRKAPFAMGVADNIGYFTEDEGFIRGNMSGLAFFRGCSAGLSGIGIDSVGNVRGCESMYADCFIEGNLRERTLRDIWEDPNAFAYNRKFTPELLTGACRECEFGAYCAGGCRSYNHFVHGKLYEFPCCAKKQA